MTVTMEEMPDANDTDRVLIKRWVETWDRAGRELEHIRRAEIESVDTQEAIRQIFGNWNTKFEPGAPTSGLVEQQKVFARLRPKTDKE